MFLVLGLIGLGYFLVLLGLGKVLGNPLSRIIFNFLFPIVIFNSFIRATFTPNMASIVLVVAIYILGSLIVVNGIVKHMKLDAKSRISTVISAVFQNSAFLPMPIAYSLYNYILPLVVYTYALILIYYPEIEILNAYVNKDKSKNWIKIAILNILKNPIIISGIAGILVNISNIVFFMPEYALSALNTLSTIGIYLSAVIVGLGLPRIENYRLLIDKAVLLVILWRQIVSPIIHMVLALIIVQESVMIKQLLLVSIMPPATVNTVVAYIYGFNINIVSRSTLISTLLSIVYTVILVSMNLL